MRILDRYILKELLGPFLFGITAFSSIFIGTGPMFRIAQLVSQYGASVAVVLKLFIYSIPSIVVLTFPMSMLLASLLSFGRLSAASEITAMRSGGQSFARLATPVFIVALLVSLVAVVLNERVVPAANAAYNYIVRYEMEKNTKPRTQEHIIIKTIKQGFMERLTYAREFSEDTGLMQSVTMQEFAADHLARVEHAEKAVWRDDHWVMQNGIIHELSPEGKVERVMRFDEQDLPVERAPVDISREQKKPEEMTIVELKQNIKILRSEYVKT
ncbi:MAG TPA: LptF/LptG family permease, partial [Patescibacteria group bacterium]|nr:LptF/LptG family permease [Patescibacteria group bacterium]